MALVFYCGVDEDEDYDDSDVLLHSQLLCMSLTECFQLPKEEFYLTPDRIRSLQDIWGRYSDEMVQCIFRFSKAQIECLIENLHIPKTVTIRRYYCHNAYISIMLLALTYIIYMCFFSTQVWKR
jgi:hypothetical protein